MIKKHWLAIILGLIGIFLLYLLIGAMWPFAKTPSLSEQEKQDIRKDMKFEEADSVDRAAIMETNRSALEERIRLISMAKEEIIISTFDMRQGESTKDILSILYHKAQQGVQVKMVVDGVSGWLRLGDENLFQAFANLPGVEIRIYNEVNPLIPWKTMGRLHDKYVIVDDMAYILGGRNMFDYFIGEYPTAHRSYDREVLVYNTAYGTGRSNESSIMELMEYYQGIWDHKDCVKYGQDTIKDETKEWFSDLMEERYAGIEMKYPELFNEYDYHPVTSATHGVKILSNPTTVYGKKPVVFEELIALMEQAEDQVVFHTPYAVLNQQMVDELKSVSDQVPVTMMLNAVENGDNVMATSDYTYRKDMILDTGVSLLEYAGGTSYHGKSVVIDQKVAVVGSYNLDLRSTYVDTELMAVIYSEDVAEELMGYMEELHQDCREVVDLKTSTVPAGLEVPKAPLTKRILWHLIGLVIQPFRILI